LFTATYRDKKVVGVLCTFRAPLPDTAVLTLDISDSFQSDFQGYLDEEWNALVGPEDEGSVFVWWRLLVVSAWIHSRRRFHHVITIVLSL
jgi:hypothetical protein